MHKFVFIPVMLGLLLGCAHTPKHMTGEEWMLSQSKKPVWLSKVPATKNGIMYFVGRKSRAVQEEAGLTDAREDAARQLAEMIAQKMNVDYEKARYEVGIPLTPEDVGSVTKDLVIALSKALVQGMKDVETYTEKWARMGKDKVIQNFYNCYVLRSVSEETYQKLANQEIDKKIEQARKEKNEKAEKLLEQFRKEIKEGK